MRERVVITGAGCITPLGHEPSVLWNALVRGDSGVSPLTLFDASQFPVRIAAEIRNWCMGEVGQCNGDWQGRARQTQFAAAAAVKAWKSSGLAAEEIDVSRSGVYFGCGEIFPNFNQFCSLIKSSLNGSTALSRKKFAVAARSSCAAGEELHLDPSEAVTCTAGLLGLEGPSANFTNACVSSSMALGEAAEVIRRGQADVMLAGGAHSMIHPFGMAGFCRLSTLSERNDEPHKASRPFERDRDGFVVGEGGAVLVLESYTHAKARGAEIWGELKGYGAAHDAFRLTDPCPDGRGAARSITLALADAQVSPADIDYVNAHGSGTQANDNMETAALKLALGKDAYRVPISSTKSMTGHLTTACGALEALVCLQTLRHGVMHPTINFDRPDPECDLDYIPNTAREKSCRHVLTNSFGFGGQNVALVLSRCS